MKRLKHSSELQALRGVAALCVLIHHTLRVLGPVGLTAWIADTLLNAHAAVVVFFVLSGFVLGSSLLNRGFSRYEISRYYIRRLFRIYPALWMSCTIGLLYFLFISNIWAPNFATWAQIHFNPNRFTVTSVILSYLGLVPFLNPPLWTILVELVCSALLPGLMLLFVRWRWSVAPALVLLAFACFAEQHSLRGVLTNFVHFGFGAALALYGTAWLRHRSMVWPALLTLIFFRQLQPWAYNAGLPSLVEGVAATFVIASIVNGAFSILLHRSLQWLGDISYSVYLLHLPIAYTVARILDQTLISQELTDLTSVSVALITLGITLPLSAISYRFIEQPGVAAGRWVLSLLYKNSDPQDVKA
jgi:peptidoglycan/LPS O-acetylase OafA/YrhL